MQSLYDKFMKYKIINILSKVDLLNFDDISKTNSKAELKLNKHYGLTFKKYFAAPNN